MFWMKGRGYPFFALRQGHLEIGRCTYFGIYFWVVTFNSLDNVTVIVSFERAGIQTISEILLKNFQVYIWRFTFNSFNTLTLVNFEKVWSSIKQIPICIFPWHILYTFIRMPLKEIGIVQISKLFENSFKLHRPFSKCS